MARDDGPNPEVIATRIAMSSSVPPETHWPAGIPLHADLRGAALFAQLASCAAATPSLCAIPASGTTYGELLDACQMLAGYMQQRLGVRRGASVLLSLAPGLQRTVAVFAIARCAARLVALEPDRDRGDIAAEAARSGARSAIVAAAAVPGIVPLLDDGTLYGCVVCGAAPARPGLHDFVGAISAGIAPLPLSHPLEPLE